jgi:AcrR family transcriptional regulator
VGRPAAADSLDTAKVVEAAAVLCDRDGWDALTLHALAAELGVRAPSLYHHVDGLPDLRAKLARVARAELRDRFLAAAAGHSGADGIRAVAHAYRDFARERPGLYPAVVSVRGDDDDSIAAANAVVDAIAPVLAPYRLDAAARVHVVRALRAALHGFVSLAQAGGFGLPQKLDASFATMIELFIAGLERR